MSKKQVHDLTVREALAVVDLIPGVDPRGARTSQGARSEGFVEVLRRLNAEFSYQGLMEVLNFPIWGRSRQEQDELRKALLELSDVTDEDLRRAMGAGAGPEPTLEKLLVVRGFTDTRALERAAQRRTGKDRSLWRELVSHEPVRLQEIGQLLFQTQAQKRVRQAEQRVLELLEVLGMIRPEKLTGLAAEPGHVPLRGLIESGKPGRERVLAVLKPYEDMVLATIDPNRRPPLDVMFGLPASQIRELMTLPLEKDGQTMTVGLVDPRMVDRLPELEQSSGYALRPVLITRADFEREVARLIQPAEDAPRRDLKALILGFRGSGGAHDNTNTAVQLAKSILEGALSARATDVHFEPQKTEMRTRFRIDGRLYDVMSLPKDMESEVLARLKILADMDIAERRRPQDGHFSIAFGGKDYNMRVSTLPTYVGEKLALRILDESNVIRGVRHLGLEEEDRIAFEELIHRPNGMLLVTGPIGSGKTTTLYSALGVLNTSESNIVTIEDPVEYQLQGVNQVQVEPELGVTFAGGLRAILRQDADILMVGEIRDPETARVAAWAAMTGQLVLCTLHTNDAIGALSMLANFGVERFVVAGAVVGVIAQRLVRQLCPDCKEPYPVAPALAAQLGFEGPGAVNFFRAKGCNFCFHTGFHGRIGVYELLVCNERMRELLLSGAHENELRRASAEDGRRTLRQNGLNKVLEGKTTLEEVMREIAL